MKNEVVKSCSENSERFKKPGNHTSLIKNYEIILRGKWLITDLPFATVEYFVCHEEKQQTTTIGARLKSGKTRKEMERIMIDLQESIQDKDPLMSVLRVDESPLLRSHPRWGCIRKSHYNDELISITTAKEGHKQFAEDNLDRRKRMVNDIHHLTKCNSTQNQISDTIPRDTCSSVTTLITCEHYCLTDSNIKEEFE